MNRRAACLVLALTISGTAAGTTPNRWTSIGPPGGCVRSIAVHPTDPGTAWVAANPGGLFRTRDAGSTWQRLRVGGGAAPELTEAALSVAVDPNNPRTVITSAIGPGGGGLWRSDDEGDSWVRIGGPGGGGSPQALVISPAPSSVMFAGNLNGLYRSTDRGDTWILVKSVPFLDVTPRGVTSIAVDPTNPSLVYAAATSGGFWKSTDGGLTFTTGSGPASALSLAIDPGHPNILYSAEPTLQRGVSRSNDSGVTWTSANAGLTDSNTRSIAVDPADPNHVWVASDGGGVFRSNDGAASWAPVAGGLTNPFGNVVVFGAGGLHAYVGYTGAGVFRSADHGASWTDSRLPAAYVQKLGWSDAALVAGVFGVGIEKTSTSGADWFVGSDGMTYPDFQSLAVSRVAPRNMASGGSGAIYSSRDAGSTWTVTAVNYCTNVTYDAGAAGTIYSWVSPMGVMRSQDAGLTWTSTIDPAGPAGSRDFVTLLRADPARPGVVFAATDFGYLFRSTDGTQTWQKTGYSGYLVDALEFDATDSRYAYVSANGHFLRSSDAGLTWTETGTLPPAVVGLASVPGTVGSLYAAVAGTGVLQTADFGATWTAVNAGLDTYDLRAIQIDPADASKVYVATNGFSVYALDRTGSPAGPCVADGSTLCLNAGRFRVRVSWRVPSQGTSGAGAAVSLTGDTGYFWFFSSNNVELVVKVVDGAAFNGKYWVFSGALTDAGYDIVVLDTVTGVSKTYSNTQGTLASFADTAAF